MPMYDFYCDCGKLHSEYRPVAQWDQPMPCPDCGEPMKRRYDTQAVRGNYKKPIRLESMGFIADPADVAEHRRRFLDVDLEFVDGSAIPVLRSLGQKRAYFKEAGLVDTRSY